MPPLISIPRPGTAVPVETLSRPPIPGPSEESFTSTFGALLPPAQFVTVARHGAKAAYYEIPPPPTNTSQDIPSSSSTVTNRVLLIHGVQTPALGMLPLAKALHASLSSTSKKSPHFVLLELWGHGLSDSPAAHPHGAAFFHELIDTVLERLDWQHSGAHFVGYSFGGALTAGYVASSLQDGTKHRAGRVKSFALVAPAGLIPYDTFLTADDKARMASGDEEVAQTWAVEWLEGGELVVPADWRERVGRGQVVAEAVKEWQMREHKGHVATVLAVVRDGGVFDRDEMFREALGAGIPACAVLGERDGLSTEGALRRVGCMDVEVVKDAGHGVVRDRVPEVAAVIERFWGGIV